MPRSCGNMSAIATYGNGVTLAPSNVPNAGNGVFATKAFRPGDVITKYCGVLLNQAQMEHAMEHDNHFWYFLTIHDDLYIDGEFEAKPGDGLASFVNDANNLRLTNSAFCIDDNKKVWLVCVKPIAPGDEIFVTYGGNYWQMWSEQYKKKPYVLKRKPPPRVF